MNKNTKIALGIGAVGVIGYFLLSGNGEGAGGAFGGGGGGGGFEPLLEPKKITTTSTSEDPGRVTNVYNLGGGDPGGPEKFFAVPEIIERIITMPAPSPGPISTTKKSGRTIDVSEPIVGTYKDKTFVLGGPTATKKMATEVAEIGYSPTMGKAFGLDPVFYTSAPTPVSAPVPVKTVTTPVATKKSSVISTIKSVAIAAVTMSQPVSFAKSVSSFISSWWR